MASKREGDGAIRSSKRFKANPKISDIAVDEAPTSDRPRKTITANAPVDVVLYKVTDAAADIWEDCVEGAPLYQIQIEHAARKPITYQMKNNFNAFLRECGGPMPGSLDDLQSTCGIRLVVGGDDPFEVGFVQWRPAFYVVGDLKNFLFLLDGWFKYISRVAVRQNPFQVRLYPNVDIDISEAWGELEYEHYTLNVPSAHLPLGFFEGTPIFGKEIIWVIRL